MKSVVVIEKLVYRAVNWIWVFVVHVWPQQRRPLCELASIHTAIHCHRWHHRASAAITMHRRRTRRRKSSHRWRQPVSFFPYHFTCVHNTGGVTADPTRDRALSLLFLHPSFVHIHSTRSYKLIHTFDIDMYFFFLFISNSPEASVWTSAWKCEFYYIFPRSLAPRVQCALPRPFVEHSYQHRTRTPLDTNTILIKLFYATVATMKNRP